MAEDSDRDEVKRGPKGGRKHTPGRDHARKSQSHRRKKFQQKKAREREASRKSCREQWAVWDALSDAARKLRPDLTPDCPRPNDE